MRVEGPYLRPAEIAWLPDVKVPQVTELVLNDLRELAALMEDLHAVHDGPAMNYVKELVTIIEPLHVALPSKPAEDALLKEFYSLTGIDEELDRQYSEAIDKLIQKIRVFSCEQIEITLLATKI